MGPLHFRSSERRRLRPSSVQTSAGAPRPYTLPSERRRIDAFDRTLTVAFVFSGVEALLWLALYLRPGPTGAPFALDPVHYLFHALAYSGFGVLLASTPFFVLAHARRGSRRAIDTQIALLVLLGLVGQLDRELQRFLGTHLTLDWCRVYLGHGHAPSAIVEALRADAALPYSSLVLALPVIVAAPIARVAARRVRWPRPSRRYDVVVLALALAVPSVVWNLPGGRGRQSKIRPASLLVWHELVGALGEGSSAPADVEREARAYQRWWSSLDPTGGWRFPDPARPLYREPVARAPRPVRRPSFVVVVLETFRARDVGAFRPSGTAGSPTPFLDSLARAPESSVYPRHTANTLPTVYAFMALHTGIPGHSRHAVASAYTHLELDAYPAALRRHGYRAMLFTGSDPDWDNQRVFADRWYDEVHYDPSDRERDREVFRRAAARIREVGRSGRPFVATLLSISNHYPFREPGAPRVAVDVRRPVVDRLHDTMRYTDTALAELVRSLRDEPFAEDTILIVTGDHGYDLGEHGAASGHTNLRHESVWVPLVIHGRASTLPKGFRPEVTSHVDLAPTILELAGIVEPNVFVGHSLLHPPPGGGEAFASKDGSFALETRDVAFVANVGQAEVAYAGADRLQQHPIAIPAGARAHAEAVFDFLPAVVDFSYARGRLGMR